MRRLYSSLSAVLAGATVAAAIAGCAAQGDVDRTQPGRVSKAVFQGEWYYRQFVTDVPSNTSIDFIGSQGSMDRIRWRITEDALVAYRAYESLPGTTNGFTGSTNDQSAPIAAFAILSHFDVKRSYNSATGEQTNVLYEDTSDRPWYQRTYMRVDWTKNQVPNIQSATEYYGFTPESYVPEVSNEIDPDRMLLTDSYIDVTTRFHVAADFCGGTDSFNNCAPASIKVRSSFLKIDKANKDYIAIDDNNKQNYEPLEYRDGILLKDDQGRYIPSIQVNAGLAACNAGIKAQLEAQGGSVEEDCTPARAEMFQKFGFFRTERAVYDRDYEVTKSGKIFYANRWNIWDGAIRDAAGAPIPVAQRRTRKITYYLNTHFPEDIFHAAQLLGADYNKAFKDTVAAMRLTEANGGQGVTQAEITAEAANLPIGFQVRQNSCNLGSWTVDTTAADFEGKYPSFEPTTSTKDWANAHPEVKTAALARLAKAGVTVSADLSNLNKQNIERFCTALEDASLNAANKADRFVWQRIGDLRFSFINWVDNDQLSGPLGFGPSDPDPVTGEIINANANVYGAAMDSYAAASAEMVQVLNGDITLQDLIAGQDIVSAVKANQERAKQMEQQPLEAAQFQRLVSLLPDTDALKALKPMADGYLQKRLERIKGTDLEAKLVTEDIAILDPNYKPGQPITQAVIDRVSPVNWALRDSPKRHEKFWKKAMNFEQHNTCLYLAEFADDAIIGWAMEQKAANRTREQIIVKARQDIFLGLTEHEVGHTVGLRHNFEGSMDALNYGNEYWKIRQQFPRAEWQQHKLSEHAYSTVMDYIAHFNADVHGLGKYDFAAIKFGYGQLLETYPTTAISSAGELLRNRLFMGNYEEIPSNSMFRNVDNINDRRTVPYAGVVEQVRSGLLAGNAVNTAEVPYRFCSDEFNGNLTCKTWDEGASQAEVVQSAANMYRNYWYFSAFRRDRLLWDPNGYLSRLSTRYFDKASTAYQYFYYYGRAYQNTFFGQDLARAAVDGLNLLNEVLATPDTGLYCLPKSTLTGVEPNVYKQYAASNCAPASDTNPTPTLNLNMFNGAKPFYLAFDDDYYYDISRLGVMYDKIAAVQALTDSTARFYRVDTFGDQRNYSINYYRTWKDQIFNIIEGIVMDTSGTYGGTMQNGKYVPPQAIAYNASLTGLAPVVTAPRVRSRVNYTVQNYILLYSMAFLNNTLDDSVDISNYMKVSLKGTKDDVEYTTVNPADIVEVTDPRTHQTYRSIQTFDNRSIGYKLVKDAADYLNGEYKRYEDAYKANPAAANALANYQAVQSVLSSKLEVLDDVRSYQATFASGQN